MTLEVAVLAQVNDMLNVLFAVIIPRVGFAREDKLNRTRGVSCQLHDVVELLEDQGRVCKCAKRRANPIVSASGLSN